MRLPRFKQCMRPKRLHKHLRNRAAKIMFKVGVHQDGHHDEHRLLPGTSWARVNDPGGGTRAGAGAGAGTGVGAGGLSASEPGLGS